MSDRPEPRPRTRSYRAVLLVAIVVAAVTGASALAADAAASSGDDENDDTRGNATAVRMNSTLEGTIDGPNDTDWYAVEAGDVKRLLAGIAPEDTSGADEDPPKEYKDVSITLYGPDGRQIATAGTDLEIAKSTAGVNHGVESGDTYYVEVASAYGDEAEGPYVEANGSQDYELDVETVPLDTNEPNDYYEQGDRKPSGDPGDATSIAAGETVSANVLRIESDTYAIELEAGDTVTVNYDVTAQVNHNGFAMPTRTVVENSSGDEVADSEVEADSPGDATYSFTANESGTYYVTATSETDSMAVSGVRGNDLTRYDLRLDVASGSGEGGGSTTTTAAPETATRTATTTATTTATATATTTSTSGADASSADESSADESSADGESDGVQSDGAIGGDGESAGDAPADSDGARTATSVPPTGTASGASAAARSGADVTGESAARTVTAVTAGTTGATPTQAAQQPDEAATAAPGQPGFGVVATAVGVLVAVAAAARLRRRSDP